MAPGDEIELKSMVMTQAAYDEGPTVLRYPRGTGYGADKLKSLFSYRFKGDEIPKGETIPIGKGRIVRRPSAKRGKARADRVAMCYTFCHWMACWMTEALNFIPWSFPMRYLRQRHNMNKRLNVPQLQDVDV